MCVIAIGQKSSQCICGAVRGVFIHYNVMHNQLKEEHHGECLGENWHTLQKNELKQCESLGIKISTNFNVRFLNMIEK